MSLLRTVLIPRLIRLKPGALQRLPIYLEREGWKNILALTSAGLPTSLSEAVRSLAQVQVVSEASWESAEALLQEISPGFEAVVGLGGGQALDVAKYLAFRLDLPYLAVPTSLSNDGFCSPQSSLTRGGRKVSLQARMPLGVVVDLEVVRGAPRSLWLSGLGDLASKWTAIHDWKLAFHAEAVPFDDFAALLSDATVFQLLGHPLHDVAGIRLLAQALLLNGVAMEVAGCSRPASGSEHLISHALDRLCARPKAHGLQVGLASYWMARLQGQSHEPMDRLFEETGFWEHWRQNPMRREDWIQALQLAPTIKDNFYTVLSQPHAYERALAMLQDDPRLQASLV
jgi:glycerol-1-phosphate dehydrogenase [NAD(P)+]